MAWDWMGTFYFALGGIFSTYFGRWFMLESIARLGPSRASAFQVSSPVFTLAIAWLFLGERLSVDVLLAMAVAGVGLLLVSLSRPSVAPKSAIDTPKTSPWQRLVRSGFLLGLRRVGRLRGEQRLPRRRDPPMERSDFGRAARLDRGIRDATRPGKEPAHGFPRDRRRGRIVSGILLFVATGVLTICAQVCVILAMARSPVAVVSLITLCTPVLVFPLSYFVLKNEEKINARTMIGALLIIAGIGAILARN